MLLGQHGFVRRRGVRVPAVDEPRPRGSEGLPTVGHPHLEVVGCRVAAPDIGRLQSQLLEPGRDIDLGAARHLVEGLHVRGTRTAAGGHSRRQGDRRRSRCDARPPRPPWPRRRRTRCTNAEQHQAAGQTSSHAPCPVAGRPHRCIMQPNGASAESAAPSAPVVLPPRRTAHCPGGRPGRRARRSATPTPTSPPRIIPLRPKPRRAGDSSGSGEKIERPATCPRTSHPR